jgi:hypothetical protein
MVRRGSPALYELMRKPGQGAGVPGGEGPAGGAPSAGPRRGSTGPALPDSFEVSLGKAAAIAAGCIVLIAIAYGIGVQRGRSVSRGPSSQDAGTTVEVVVPPAPVTPGSTVPPGGATPAAPRKATGADRATAATDNTVDPRVKGVKYYVLAHPSSDRASEMVEFCRENGLEAFLVPDDNALLRKIIVLPGYRDASEKNSPEIKALEAKIRSVGDKWKRSSRGNKDFSDAYPELHR